MLHCQQFGIPIDRTFRWVSMKHFKGCWKWASTPLALAGTELAKLLQHAQPQECLTVLQQVLLQYHLQKTIASDCGAGGLSTNVFAWTTMLRQMVELWTSLFCLGTRCIRIR